MLGFGTTPLRGGMSSLSSFVRPDYARGVKPFFQRHVGALCANVCVDTPGALRQLESKRCCRSRSIPLPMQCGKLDASRVLAACLPLHALRLTRGATNRRNRERYEIYGLL